MPIKLLKSQIVDEAQFSAAVNAHIEALKAFLLTEGAPRPTASPMIEASIRRVPEGDNGRDDFIADYEIEDDTPPPPTAEQVKLLAVLESRRQEEAEVASIIPPGKMRVLEMDYARVLRVKQEERTPDQTQLLQRYVSVVSQIEDARYAGALREAALDEAEAK